MQLFLTIDIGNTNIVVALFNEDTLVSSWRLHTDVSRTGDEYGILISSFFTDGGFSVADIESCIISSVVPNLIGPFVGLIVKKTGKKPFIISPGIFSQLPITIPESATHEIGSDLVCNAVEAYCRYKGACIVVDFGTALTFTAVSSDGSVLGIAITPGIGTARDSLFKNTAQLPSIPLKAPPSVLGKNTIHSIQAGIVLGYKCLVEGLVQQIKEDMGKETGIPPEDIKVVATGGLNSVLEPISTVFQEIDKTLTLRGLHRIGKILRDKGTAK
ncbi:MAG: type III pantothenate kinase [Candidatus Treponema excrementipullorum]|nr:type III pantothenate kinase [Spirochaetia bacterium]MDD7013175.1 type III pantothenate kinase [Candidatus Treponema excrementipullorum]MCI6954363.1 type III pantothenate kinase [Spirochaetia bacterium]MDY2754819.1 type III pantothenate kinase [Candidatus Treponema excrementipullorum]MDY4465141.1 type III pantothenate kinase [Candidatus Treponema excrementipullorum]